MKILLCSDIHGRLEAAKLLVKRFEEERPDHIYFLGDILYNGPRNGVPDDYDPMGVCELLKPFDAISDYIQGNCDSRVDETVLGVKMPLNLVFSAFGHRFVLFHGDTPSFAGLSFEERDIRVSGHTHIAVLDLEKEPYRLNPGSVGFPRDGERSYMTLEEKGVSRKRLEDGSVLLSHQLP